MKKFLPLILFMFLVSCGGGSGNSPIESSEETIKSPDNIPLSDVSNKKILASNVIFRNGGAVSNFFVSKAQAQEAVDTTTKVLAENVVLDSNFLALAAQDVQSAFEEAQPDLNQTIIGTWSITELAPSDSIGFTVSGGTITFNGDDTYSLINASSTGPIGAIVDKLNDAESRNKFLEYRVTDNMYVSLRVSADDRSLCSTTNCDPADQNNGTNCSCGGFGPFENAPCIGGCSGFIPQISTNRRTIHFNVHKATMNKINLGTHNSSILLTRL